MDLATSVHENLNPVGVSFNFYWGMVAISFLSAVGVVAASKKN